MIKCRTCLLEKDEGEFAPGRKQCKSCTEIYSATKRKNALVTAVEVPSNPPRDVDKFFELAVALRQKGYQESALDAIHALATMEVNGNAMLAQTKFLAACKLVGPMPWESSPSGSPADGQRSVLERLNESYQAAAIRIKEIRERTIRFENGETSVVSAE